MPRRLRRSTRLVLSALLAALIVPALAAGGHAEDRQITLTVKVGYRDVTRAGQWMPVNVDATNHGSDFQGTLEVQSQDFQGFAGKGAFPGPYGQGGLASYRLPLNLPAGATKHLRSYIVSDNPSPQVVVRLVENGRVAATQSATTPTGAGLLVGVLSDQPSALDDFGVLRLPGSLTPQVIHLRRDDLSDSGILLRAFDVLAIDDFATDSLTTAQRTALGDYVAMGGNLLLGSGAAWHKTLGGLPADLIPMEITGTIQLKGSKALPDSVEIATGTGLNGHVWLADGGTPLLIERSLGNGSITLAAFDWAQDPIFGWSGTRGLLRKYTVRNFYIGQGQAMPFGIGGAGGAMPYYGGNTGGGSVTQRSNTLMGALANLPALDLPSLRVTGLLILLYVLLVGPLNYLVLRAIGRRELAWITVPVVALIFAAGAYGLAVGTKGRSVQSNQVSIVHVTPGWKDAYQEAYTGIFTPTRGDYSISIGGSRSLIAPLANYGGPVQGNLRVFPDQNAVDLLGVTAYTLRGFATESTVSAPRLTATLKLSAGKLVGRVENHSSITFPDAVVVAGDSYQMLGKLAPGAGVDVSLEAKLFNPYQGGPPLAYRIYSQGFGGYYGPGGNVGRPTDSQREAQERSQVLQLLIGSFRGGSPSISPMLVAWTTDSVQPIKVNGNTPRPHALNAIALPIPVDDLAAGPLPAGVVTARLVDLDGESQSSGPPGMLYIQSGSATLEFSPRLVKGTRLTEMSISSSNPYGGKFGPGGNPNQQSVAYKSEAWDWSKSAWVSISLKDNAAAAVPDNLFDSATGTLRLRISSVNGSSFQLSNLSLTGTLQ